MNIAMFIIVNLLAIVALILVPRYLRKRKESKEREKLLEQMLNSTRSAKSELISFLKSKRSEFYSEEIASKLSKLEADLESNVNIILLESRMRVGYHDLMFGGILPQMKENSEFELNCMIYLMHELLFCITAKGCDEKEMLEERLYAVSIFLKALNSPFFSELYNPKFADLRA